jgi:hypothetical protein
MNWSAIYLTFWTRNTTELFVIFFWSKLLTLSPSIAVYEIIPVTKSNKWKDIGYYVEPLYYTRVFIWKL